MVYRAFSAVMLLMMATLCGAMPHITYTLRMDHPSTHLFEVEIQLENLARSDSSIDCILPAWRSGRYMIFDFAGGVERFSAQNESGEPITWFKTDKNTWHVVVGRARTVSIRYMVFANESTMRTRGLDESQGFVDGTSVFMYVQQYRGSPLSLAVHPYAGWHVTTGLDSIPGQFAHYQVSDYDLLADCPLVIGTQRDFSFSVRGIPHVLSISGRTNYSADSMIIWIKQIVEMDAEYWGGLPYTRYVFLFRALPNGGGATEHINSSVLDVQESALRTPVAGREHMGLFSHEFFHTWNVKRLRPHGMNPYDWTKENYYRELWLAEGGTVYLETLLRVRKNLSPLKSYLWNLSQEVASDRQQPGNKEQSIADCSFDAWIKFNKPSDDAYNVQTDIYSRGADVSLMLDLELRQRTGNRASLDDLLRLLYKRFPLGSPGYTLDDLEAAAAELGGTVAREFFTKYIRGVEPLPWESELDHAGIALTPVKGSPSGWLGISAFDERGRIIVHRVIAGSPGYDAGLDNGDQLLALDGVRLHADDLARRIAERSPGDTVRMSFFHHDTLVEKTISLITDPIPSYTVHQVDKPDTLQKTIYESWLGHGWGE